MRPIVWFVGTVLWLGGGAALAQGVADDSLAPLPSVRELARVQASNLAARQESWPSGRTRELFHSYRAWLAYLGRHGLEAEFADEVRERSRRMAEILAGRFEELVEECRAGNPTVLPQMREIARYAALYPALVQHLGASWFERAEEEMRRCGIPNWAGFVTAGQADAFDSGYFMSAHVEWILDQVDEHGEATYVAAVSDVIFEIPPGECEVYEIDRATPNLATSFLRVDFELQPPVYQGVLTLDVAFTIRDRCDNEAPPFRMSAPFPVMLQLDDWALVDANREEIEGAYLDPDTEYASRWYFTAVERE